MHNQQDYTERDELRARFTGWLDATLYHAKLRYLEKEAKQIETVSLDDLPDYYYAQESNENRKNEFDFEEERLASAFANLPAKRQIILSMLYEDQMKPAEIAKQLHCSVRHIYRQRWHAIEALRKALITEEHYDS